MGGAPPPPSNQPSPRPLQPAPPVAAGFGFTTVKDWFLKFTNIRELANGDHFEQVNGVRISLALSLMSAITLGWYHSSIIGGSLTHIKGKDLKIGLLAYLGFVNANKTEITKANKDEYIYGLKLSHVTGKKNKFQGSNRLSNSAVEKAEFMNKCSEYWTLRKEIAAVLKETIKTLNAEHTHVEEGIQKSTREITNATQESDDTKIRADTLTAQIDNLMWQAQTAKAHATADLKVIADAAVEFEAGAAWEGDLGSQLKLHCSFQEFAASISKLG